INRVRFQLVSDLHQLIAGIGDRKCLLHRAVPLFPYIYMDIIPSICAIAPHRATSHQISSPPGARPDATMTLDQ
ncbi:MAG: hypothetical protein ACRDHE_05825, partial [Ktedonobacterales bacterium]